MRLNTCNADLADQPNFQHLKTFHVPRNYLISQILSSLLYYANAIL